MTGGAIVAIGRRERAVMPVRVAVDALSVGTPESLQECFSRAGLVAFLAIHFRVPSPRFVTCQVMVEGLRPREVPPGRSVTTPALVFHHRRAVFRCVTWSAVRIVSVRDR